MSYFQIPADQLGQDARIPLLCLGDSGEIFYEMALEMIGEIEQNNAAGRPTVLIVPVGPVGQYPTFVRLVNARRVSLKNCWFFNMDEYLDANGDWIDPAHKLSFRGFMAREVYGKIDPALVMPEEQRIFPDPHDPARLTALIEQLGGADAAFGGIGINGHLAFNEPQPALSEEAFLALSTRVLRISDETRVANAIGDLGGAIAAMPTHCVTIGMREIYAAKKIRLGVFRDWHRSVVRQAAYGEVGTHFPISLCQKHPDTRIYVNRIAAAQPF